VIPYARVRRDVNAHLASERAANRSRWLGNWSVPVQVFDDAVILRIL